MATSIKYTERETLLKVFTQDYIFIALGCNIFIHEDINKVFNKDPALYYEHFNRIPDMRKSLSPLFSILSYVNENMVHKILAICAYETEVNGNCHSFVISLIKKGYRPAFLYFEDYKRSSVNISLFAQYFDAKRKGADNYSDNDLNFATVALCYLCSINGVEAVVSAGYGDHFVTYLSGELGKVVQGSDTISILSKEAERVPVKEQYLATYWPLKGAKETTLARYIESFTVRGVNEIVKKKVSPQTMVSMRDKLLQKLPNKYYSMLGVLSVTYGVDCASFMDRLAMSKDEVQALLTLLRIYNSDNNDVEIKEDEYIIYFGSAVIIKALATAYRELKQEFFKFSEEQYYADLSKKDKEIHSLTESLSNIKEMHLSTEAKDKERIKTLEKELSSATKEISSLKKELSKKEDFGKEVVALREFAYRAENPDIEDRALTEDDMCSYINSKKIAIVGGHTNWINKLKQLLPDARYLEPDALGRDYSIVSNVDFIYVFVGCLNHPSYRKMMASINRSTANLEYFTNHVNINLSLQEIYFPLKAKLQ